MLEVKKIPSLALSKVVLRNDITSPMNKGSVYLFATKDAASMYDKISKFTQRSNKFNILSLKAAYHPNNDYVFFNSANKLRFVNYRKTFTSEMNTRAPKIPIVRTFIEQLKGLNFVYCVPYFFETAKGYAKENKSEILFSKLLEKFRTEVGIPTKYPTKDGRPPVEDKTLYPARYFIFDIDDFDLPTMSEINVSRAAKHPDILRNFLYFLENESSKYLHLLDGIYFLFVSSKGVIKLKLDSEYNIVEEFEPNYSETASFTKSGEKIKFIINEAAASKANKNPATELSSSVRTLVLLMHKIKNDDIKLTKEDEVVVNKAIVVSDSEEKNNADLKAVDDMRQLDAVVDTLPDTAVEELSDELMQIDNDVNANDKHSQQVAAIMSKVEDARQQKVKAITPRERGAIAKMQNLEIEYRDNKKTIAQLTTEPENLAIPKMNIPIESHAGYEENSFHAFTDAYNDQVKARDIVAAVSHFQNAEIPLYVDKISITDNSDPYNELDTVSTRFRDEDGNTFTVTVDLPKMYKGNRIKINSSEKVMIGQLTYLPILKIDDSVIITTNYNKVFMEKKYGNGLTPQANKLIRALKKMEENKDVDSRILFGDYSTSNASSLLLSEEMKELSGYMLSIGSLNGDSIKSNLDFKSELDSGKYEKDFFLSFNDSDVAYIHNMIAPADIGDHTVIGFLGGTDKPILLDMHSSRISIPSMGITDSTIYSTILQISDEYNVGIRPYYDDIKTINKLTSTYVKIMNNWIPLIYILIYTDGLYSIMEKLGVQYEIVPAEEKQRRTNKEKEIKVELSDCTLYISIEDVASSILFYPLQDADLSMYSLADLEKPENTGSVLVENTNGDINFPLYIHTFKSCFIDPYTKGILEYLDQPTDFVGVFLYANNLLASPLNMEELSLNSCRIRYAEVIQAVYYKELANAYAEYSAKKKRGSKSATMSIPRDKVCTQVMALPNVEEYSRINPYQESVKRYSCNYKGHLGKNVSRAYTWKARAYHPSYIGAIGLPTAFSANIGINKQLTIDPKVTNLRGMFEVTDDPNTLPSKSLITSTEAITIGSATHSDAPRNAMNQSQKSHIIPIEDMETGYVTNSYDRQMAYMTDDFVERAERGDGTILKVTENYVTVQYKDGYIDAIKLKRLHKNSAKGKFVVSYMKPVVREGQKIKSGDIIAHDKDFFKHNGLEGLVATMGTMLNIIWKPEACVYEDSVVISESASKKLVNIAIKRVGSKFHKNSKILSYIKLGEYVNADTELMSYVEGTEDDMMSEFLDRSEMTDLDKKVRTAHKAGTIFNIRITHACDKATMSSSVGKMISDITKQITSINEEDTLQKSHNSFNKREYSELPQEVKGGHKMNGEVIDKDYILVEYFIEYPDFAGIGDKGSQFTALKGIKAKVLPDDEMPVGLDSGRRTDMICSPYSPGARKTFDVNHVFVQNVLMEKLTNDARETFLGKDWRKIVKK